MQKKYVRKWEHCSKILSCSRDFVMYFFFQIFQTRMFYSLCILHKNITIKNVHNHPKNVSISDLDIMIHEYIISIWKRFPATTQVFCGREKFPFSKNSHQSDIFRLWSKIPCIDSKMIELKKIPWTIFFRMIQIIDNYQKMLHIVHIVL